MQAWERAKGELQSIVPTYWSGEEAYEEFIKLKDKFVKEVEDNGYVE